MQSWPHLKICLALSAVFAVGCSAIEKMSESASTPASKIPQDQEMEFASPIKLKIVHCYWAGTVNRLDGADWGNDGAVPNMTVKADDAFLVVEIALTNYGASPMMPKSPPIFELKSTNGTIYQQDSRVFGMNQINTMGTNIGTNINPGKAVKGRLVFDVPKGNYDLQVDSGRWNGSGFSKSGVLWTWKLDPAESK